MGLLRIKRDSLHLRRSIQYSDNLKVKTILVANVLLCGASFPGKPHKSRSVLTPSCIKQTDLSATTVPGS